MFYFDRSSWFPNDRLEFSFQLDSKSEDNNNKIDLEGQWTILFNKNFGFYENFIFNFSLRLLVDSR